MVAMYPPLNMSTFRTPESLLLPAVIPMLAMLIALMALLLSLEIPIEPVMAPALEIAPITAGVTQPFCIAASDAEFIAPSLFNESTDTALLKTPKPALVCEIAAPPL